MSKQVLLYDEEHEEVQSVQVGDDTFVLAKRVDGKLHPMTYGEWEALRCEQACAATKERAAREIPEGSRDQVCTFLDAFTESMRVKYLEGKRSWGQIYQELLEDFEAFAR